eukprot:COSAG06_NODE_1368_length_9679_cov_3.238055_2_plen_370_part_00
MMLRRPPSGCGCSAVARRHRRLDSLTAHSSSSGTAAAGMGGARAGGLRRCAHSTRPPQPPQPPLSAKQLAIAPFVGAAAGFITASVGVGAAAVQVPLLTASWTLGLPHVIATSTGMASTLAGVAGAAYKYSAADTVDPVIAGSLALPAMATSVLGAKLAGRLSPPLLKLIWACVAATAATGAIYTSRPKQRDGDEDGGASRRPRLPPGQSDGATWPPAWASYSGLAERLERLTVVEGVQHAAAGAFVGLLNGLIGVGGTPFVMAYLALFTDMTQHEVLGTTMVAVVPGVITGVATHALLGNLHWRVLPLLCTGSMAGAAIGAGVSLSTDELRLKQGFACIMTVIATSVMRSAVRGGALQALPVVWKSRR